MKGSVWRDIVAHLSTSEIQLLIENDDCFGCVLRYSSNLKTDVFAEVKTLLLAKVERSLDCDQVLFALSIFNLIPLIRDFPLKKTP